MFIAMGGSQKGISFRDLLCGLVVLTNGELEEQIKCMSFTLFCVEILFMKCFVIAVCLQLEVSICFLE